MCCEGTHFVAVSTPQVRLADTGAAAALRQQVLRVVGSGGDTAT
jgi:hypothetical protein